MSDLKYKNIGSPKDRLLEEIGELLQAIGKGERFGWYNHHPNRNDNNMSDLINEWLDVKEAYSNFFNSIGG
jgi:NTP pyrophosphatase (non-canonical NTP hydrolase)